MRLLYGTYNPAKLASMRRALSHTGIELIGLSELEQAPADVDETGDTPLENARLKATAYRDATGMTTLAADSALYIDGLSDDRQPAVHARRMQGERMDDEAMIRFYADLVRPLGGKAVARYRNALCIAFADGRMAECFDDSVASEAFYLVDTPHPHRNEGFPLDSLSVDIKSGKYYYDLAEGRADTDLVQENGFVRFIRGALGPSGEAV